MFSLINMILLIIILIRLFKYDKFFLVTQNYVMSDKSFNNSKKEKNNHAKK